MPTRMGTAGLSLVGQASSLSFANANDRLEACPTASLPTDAHPMTWYHHILRRGRTHGHATHCRHLRRVRRPHVPQARPGPLQPLPEGAVARGGEGAGRVANGVLG